MADILKLTESDDTKASEITALLGQLSGGQVCERSQLSKVVENPNTELWVALEEGHIVGMLTLALITKTGGTNAQIEDVVVDEGQRGKGLGQSLCEKAIERAKERGARKIYLTSRPERVAANKLYQKLGFEKHETNVYLMKL